MKKQLLYFAFIFTSLFLCLWFIFKPIAYSVEAEEIKPTQANSATESTSIKASVKIDQSIIDNTQVGAIDWLAEIKTNNETLRGQLGEYRNAYRSFLVARDQFYNLETLQSINELVNAWKRAMDRRIVVMQTYFISLQLHLHKQIGINALTKQDLLEQLDTNIQIMKAHQSKIVNANDRATLSILADEYVGLNDSWQNVVYATLSWIDFAKLQQVFLSAQELQTLANEKFISLEENIQLKERQRALDEINSVLLQTEDKLILIKGDLEDKTAKQKIDKSDYDFQGKNLESVYILLNKAIIYYQELAKLYDR